MKGVILADGMRMEIIHRKLLNKMKLKRRKEKCDNTKIAMRKKEG